LGTYGVGLISQLINFNNLLLAIGALGIPLGLTKYISQWEKEGKFLEIRSTLGKFIKLIILIGSIIVLLTIIFSDQISILILDNNSFSFFFIILVFALPFSLLTSVFDSYIRGLKRFSHYVKISVITSAISVVVCLICVLLWGIIGMPIFILSSSVLILIVYISYFKKTGTFSLNDLNVKIFPLSNSMKSIFKIGAASLVDIAIYQVTLLFIRSKIIQYLGVEANGIYQAINAISNNYLGLFILSLIVYVLPILSEKNQQD
jgi:O-antigen/teichoic acid export membrane protein